MMMMMMNLFYFALYGGIPSHYSGFIFLEQQSGSTRERWISRAKFAAFGIEIFRFNELLMNRHGDSWEDLFKINF
jgi:hypothetical protein